MTASVAIGVVLALTLGLGMLFATSVAISIAMLICADICRVGDTPPLLYGKARPGVETPGSR